MNVKVKNWHTPDKRPNDGDLVIVFLSNGSIWPSHYYDIDGGSLYVKMGCGWCMDWDLKEISRWALIDDCNWYDTTEVT